MGGAGSDEQKRAEGQLDKLLQELRVALPGVQMLFGFLLVVPFNERFQRLTTAQRTEYYVVFVAAALASIALIAPSPYHRLQKGRHVHELLHVANRLAIIGLALLAVAIVGCVHLVSTVVFGGTIATTVAALVAAVAAGLWFLLPLGARDTNHRSSRVSS